MFKPSLRRLRPALCPLPLRTLTTSTLRRADPWILPNTPQHEAATQTDPASASQAAIPPLPRTHETPETTRARLLYQSRKRGTLETDLLLSTFAQERLPGMSSAELREYDQLLDEPDWDIYYWSTGKREPPARWKDTPLLAQLRHHTRNEGKVVRRMPDLSASAPASQ